MVVDEQCIVTIAYDLREGGPDGTLMERMDANYPFKFYVGNGRLLPAFEEHLLGLKEGQRFSFLLSPEEGYGERQSGNIIAVPRKAFEHLGDNVLVVDNYVTLTDDEGEDHNGRILSWDEDQVQVDFNHAMAGKHLHFSGSILHVRPATVAELIRKNYIEEDGLRNPGGLQEEW